MSDPNLVKTSSLDNAVKVKCLKDVFESKAYMC